MALKLCVPTTGVTSDNSFIGTQFLHTAQYNRKSLNIAANLWQGKNGRGCGVEGRGNLLKVWFHTGSAVAAWQQWQQNSSTQGKQKKKRRMLCMAVVLITIKQQCYMMVTKFCTTTAGYCSTAYKTSDLCIFYAPDFCNYQGCFSTAIWNCSCN